MKKRILLIDDEQDILDILSMLLKSENYEIETALNGKIALDKCESQKFDAAVCDLLMPVMNGIDLIKALRAKGELLPFIFLSGHAGRPEELEMVNFGAYQLIHKPNVEKVPHALKTILQANTEVRMLESTGGISKEFLDLLHDTPKKAV